LKKKRRNRWGEANEELASSNNTSTHNSETLLLNNLDSSSGKNDKKTRKSRWASPELKEETAAVNPHDLLQQSLVLKLKLQQVSEKLMTVVRDAALAEQDPNRSPSPPPKYDASGKRTNTREMRMRESFSKERISIIESLLKINPHFQPPPDFVKAKPVRRIYIPRQTNPLYNYIGLIIGPRGNTQKQMEQETGCKISIRGKGSQKEGSKGRAAINLDEDEELHVHVTGDDEDKVEKAAKMVEDLFSPAADDELEQHKQKQLRELVTFLILTILKTYFILFFLYFFSTLCIY
jgi:splicing factor 1